MEVVTVCSVAGCELISHAFTFLCHFVFLTVCVINKKWHKKTKQMKEKVNGRKAGLLFVVSVHESVTRLLHQLSLFLPPKPAFLKTVCVCVCINLFKCAPSGN